MLLLLQKIESRATLRRKGLPSLTPLQRERLRGTPQPPLTLFVDGSPPAGNLFHERSFEHVLKGFAVPMLKAGAPGAGKRLALGSTSGPESLPAMFALFCSPRSFQGHLSCGFHRPGAYGIVRMARQSSAGPFPMQNLRLADGEDPCSVKNASRFLSERARRDKQSGEQHPDFHRKHFSRGVPPEASCLALQKISCRPEHRKSAHGRDAAAIAELIPSSNVPTRPESPGLDGAWSKEARF